MNEDFAKKPGALFWILGIAFLLWNAFGCAMYVMDQMMTDAQLMEAYGDKGQAMLDAKAVYPIWAVSAYAIAVWGGLLAAIMLLLKKKWAAPLFLLSLLAAIICFIPNFTNATMKAAGGDTFWVMPVIVILLGLLEVWWSRKKAADGTLS